MTRLTPWIFLVSAWTITWPHLADSPPNLENTLQAQHERISKDPRNAVAWNDLGNLLILANRSSEAEEAYRQAISLSPNDTTARFNLALLLHQQGEAAEAAKELEELIGIEPRHAWAHYQLGTILADRKDRTGALEHYARALAYDPGLSFAENNPHIIENPLFGEALLRSQRYRGSEAIRVPRLYGEPERIVEMMLDYEMAESEAAGKSQDAEGAEGKKDKKGKGKKGGKGGGGSGSQARFDPAAAPGADRAREGVAAEVPARRGSRQGLDTVVVGQPPPAQVPGTSAADDESGASGRRSITRLLPPRSSATTPLAGGRGRVPPSSAAPQALDETPPPVRYIPPPPTRSSRYRPGRQSTSRLELKLLPEEEVPARYASVEPGG